MMGRRDRRFLRRMARRADEPVSPQLIEANRLFEAGDYVRAAEGYEQLALLAARRSPRYAARLWIGAGRARMLANQEAQALSLFRQALDFLAQEHRWLALHIQGNGIVRWLREQGFNRPADQVAAYLSGQPMPEPAPAQPPASASPRSLPRLPLRCPACGGPLDPREVEWVDEVTAECGYCGGMVRAIEG